MSKTSKAFAFSIACHAVLLSGLALLRPAPEPGTGAAPRYLEIAILTAAAPAESPSADAAPAGASADSVADATKTTAAAGDAAVEPASAFPEDAGVEPTPELPEDAPAPMPSPAVPIRARAGTEAASVQTPLPSIPPPAPVVVRETTPIPAAEAARLEARVEAWADGFAALGEWRRDDRWEDRDGTYTASVTHRPDGSGDGYDEAIVTISTLRDGQTLTTRVRMQRLGFSHYAQFIDRWDPQVRIHDDEIDGRFHSNSDIFIQRSRGVQPTFLGKVTTARSVDASQSDQRVNRDQVFLGGLETRVERIALPGRVSLFGDALPDAEQVLQLEGDTRITFGPGAGFVAEPWLSPRERRRLAAAGGASADGTAAPGRRPIRGTLPADAPFFILGSDDAAVHVSGRVNGRVLIYSPEDIVIEGSLVYAANPIEEPASDDYLGLVADGSVVVADPDVTGPGSLTIHAAIYARGQFAVRRFRSRSSGELSVLGSITAGSLTATEPRFSTRLVFDKRLAQTRPPHFPVTDRFEIAGWDGRWTVEP